jgi:hypothetical protein
MHRGKPCRRPEQVLRPAGTTAAAGGPVEEPRGRPEETMDPAVQNWGPICKTEEAICKNAPIIYR